MARRAFSLGLLTALAMVALLTFAAAPADAQKKGGVLRVGNLGEPPALDAHWTTASITEMLTNHIYEGLYSLDDDNKPDPDAGREPHRQQGRPHLHLQAPAGRQVPQRQGDDRPRTWSPRSKRWGKQSIYGKALFAQVADLRARGQVHRRDEAQGEVGDRADLARGARTTSAAIYPKEIAEKFPPEEKVTEYVGTGPFKLAEWKPDQYIRMVRFDDYKSRSEKPNGYGGGKIAYVDEIRWVPVPEVATRVAQVETGELDFARRPERSTPTTGCKANAQRAPDRLQAVLLARGRLQQEGRPDDEPEAAPGLAGGHRHRADHEERGRRQDASSTGWTAAWPRSRSPPGTRRSPGLPWNEHNRDKAKQLLQEAGYKGEPIRFMTTQEYKWMYDFALRHQAAARGRRASRSTSRWWTGPPWSSGATTPRSTTSSPPAWAPSTTRPTTSTSPRAGPAGRATRSILKLQAELARETDPKKRLRALGAADPAVLREGAGHPLRRPLRPARGPQHREGLQREDRARPRSTTCGSRNSVGEAPRAADSRGARDQSWRAGDARRRSPSRHDRVSRPAPPRRHPGDGGGGDGRVPAHPPDPRRSGERDAGARRDPDPDRGHARGARARPAAARAAPGLLRPGAARRPRPVLLPGPAGDHRDPGAGRAHPGADGLRPAGGGGDRRALRASWPRAHRGSIWDRVLMLGSLLGRLRPRLLAEPQLHLPVRGAPGLAARRGLRVALRRAGEPRCATWCCPRSRSASTSRR